MFNNVTIKSRLIFVIGFQSLLLVVIGVTGLSGINRSNEGLEQVYKNHMLPAVSLGLITDKINRGRMLAVLAAHAPGAAAAEKDFAEAKAPDEELDKLWDGYIRLNHTAEEQQLVNIFADQSNVYRESRNTTFRLAAAGNFAAAKDNLFNKAGPKFNEARETLFRIMKLQGELSKGQYETAQDRYATIRNITTSAIVIGVLLAIMVGYLLIRAIIGPLNAAVDVAGRIARGDLNNNIAIQSSDEIGDLLRALREMNEKLIRIVTDVRQSAGSVTASAREISQGNTDLSQRTEEQASSLEETAASMEEMTVTVKQNADSANQANQLAASARDQAEQGGAVVGRAVTAMSAINSASSKIADIIGVIDEIAFQTNLLALNAAVEAARAGDQGRGFAVVASEVRNLAQRSAAAAKEIKELINDSVDKVKSGTVLVDETGATLKGIVEGVKKVTDIVAEIAASSQEQSTGIEQVNKAVMQMDEMTRRNAALVEEMAAASVSMEEQSGTLAKLVAFFRVGGETQAEPAPVVAHRAEVHQLPPRKTPAHKPERRPPEAKSARRAVSAPAPVEGVWHEF